MILELTLKQDERTKEIMQEQAAFDPSQAVKDRTFQVISDFTKANTIRQKPYAEFNFNSLSDRISLDQTSYNQYPGEQSKDPLEAWKSLAFRPIVRNKIISIAAHVTSSLIYPTIYAQNENDEEDRDAASVMRDIFEWTCEQSKYPKTLLYSIIAALVNPAAFIYTGYAEVHRQIKEIKEDGTWTEKRVLDELYSGFKDVMVPVDELWISNIYVHDIQGQPYVIWRKVIDYTTAKQKYGEMENFKHVVPGLQFLYSNLTNLFYQQYDQSLQGDLVEEVIYYNRLQDLELRFVNGILMDEDVDRPIQRKDKNYPFAKGGYELFDDGRFFYYKSLAFKLANDEAVVNTAYRMVIDGTYLQIMPPSVVFGNEEIGTSVIAPGAITTIDNSTNPNAAFQTIGTNNNLAAGMNLLDKVEGSISESSASDLQNGQAPAGDSTAYEIAKIDQNARIMLGLFAKMIGFMVSDYAELRISDILQYATVGEVADTQSPGQMLKFRKFLLPDQTIDGKKKTKRIEFDMNLPEEGTAEELMDISSSIAEEETNKYDNNTKIYKANPSIFRSLKFKCVVKPEAITPKSDALMKALNLEEYDRAIANPLANQEAVTRDLLFASYDKTRDDPDKYMKEPEPAMPQGGQPGMPQMNANQPPKGASLLAGDQPMSTKTIAKTL